MRLKVILYYFILFLFLCYLTGILPTFSEYMERGELYKLHFRNGFIGLLLIVFFAPMNIIPLTILTGSFYFNEIKKKKSGYSFLVSFIVGTLIALLWALILSICYKKDFKNIIQFDFYYLSYWVACLFFCLIIVPIHGLLRKRFSFLSEPGNLRDTTAISGKQLLANRIKRVIYYLMILLLTVFGSTLFGTLLMRVINFPIECSIGKLIKFYPQLTVKYFVPYHIYIISFVIALYYYSEDRKTSSQFAFFFSFLICFFFFLLSICYEVFLLDMYTLPNFSHLREFPIFSFKLFVLVGLVLTALLLVHIHSYFRKKFTFLNEAK